MCTEGMARAFRGSYPAIGACTLLVCIYIVSISPPLHAEIYSTTAIPINGTLQVVVCDERVSMHLSTGEVLPTCDRVVDQPRRLHVEVYHVSMGIPFLACTAIGAIFCSLTKREDSSVFSENLLFVTDSYYSPVSINPSGDSEGSTMYTWEISFWIYIMALHLSLVSTITSPVDIFDTVVSVLLGVLSIMFLCRPRGSDRMAAGVQAVVLSCLIGCTWITFASIPHVYEADRAWLFLCLLLLDGLLLLVHMYDGTPTMYTIVMGRLTYVSLANLCLAYAFYSLEDRLEEYIHRPNTPYTAGTPSGAVQMPVVPLIHD